MESWDGCGESGEAVVLVRVQVVKRIGYICGPQSNATDNTTKKGREGKGRGGRERERKEGRNGRMETEREKEMCVCVGWKGGWRWVVVVCPKKEIFFALAH